MADVFSKRKRSEVMSRIRSRGNQETEVALAGLLRRHGIKGWRRHQLIVTSPRPSPHRLAFSRTTLTQSATTLSRSHGRGTGGGGVSVRPDFVFRQARLAVFVDGCFWHGCPRHATKPKNNASFWRRKLSGNQRRDKMVNRMLRRAGWRVVRIWECELQKRPEGCVKKIRQMMKS